MAQLRARFAEKTDRYGFTDCTCTCRYYSTVTSRGLTVRVERLAYKRSVSKASTLKLSLMIRVYNSR